MPYSTAEEVDRAHKTLTDTFKRGKTKSLAWRKWQLKQIWWMVADNEERLLSAFRADLHRHVFESKLIDLAATKADVLYHLSKLEEWAADEIPEGAGFMFGTLCRARVRREPLGVALIIAAWNFPLATLIQPLIAAVTAGCCCMLKPSEMAAATQDTLKSLVEKYLDPEGIQMVTGGPQESSRITEKRYDQIFYTGNPTVGRIVQAAAAKNLTPTVLELGGQCPVIVTKNANLELAAKRIAVNKFVNAGQACLAANHIFVDPLVHDEFISRATFWLKEITASAESKQSITHIINERHFNRVSGLLAGTKGKVLTGGEQEMNKESRFIPPTLISDVTLSDSTMSEEIFGPLLPVLKADWRSACTTLASMEHPLGLYIFSTSQSEIDSILAATTSGGVTVNDVMFHPGVPTAPFGGVGNSGTGAYHGKYGFEAFSHRRTVVQIPDWFEYLLGFRYPPYTDASIAKIPKIKNPGFKRGEGQADQVIGRPAWQTGLASVARTGTKWALVAVALALVDARFGGKSRVFGLLRDLKGRVRV